MLEENDVVNELDSNLPAISVNKLNKPLSNLQMLIIFFFIYAVIGWLLETLYCVYTLGHFEKRGFLYGPLCPIYGYGVIILLVVLKPFNKNKITLFISSAIIFSVFEYLVSYGLDALFAMKFWDYTNDAYNINGRIALWFSVIWGFFGILFLNYIHPVIKSVIDKLLGKTNYIVQHIILYTIIVVYCADTIFSIVKYII